MTQRTLLLDSALSDYLLQIGVRESPELEALRLETAHHRMAKMQIAPEQGQLLAWLARLIGAQRYLEVGVFTGYSCLAVTQALVHPPQVVACDVCEEFTRLGKKHWDSAGVTDYIDLILQPACLTLAQLRDKGYDGFFDLMFIDADKPSVPEYVEFGLHLLRPAGVMAIDNVFSGGRVVSPEQDDPPGVHILHDFNQAIKKDPRVDLVTLPVGDGLTLLRKKT